MGRQKLTFENVIKMDSLSEFDLLRDSRFQYIQSKPWADTKNRVLHNTFYKVEQAKEEVTRLNVEIGRVRNWMWKEEDCFATHLQSLSDPSLAAELGRWLRELKRDFVIIEERLV